MASLRKDTTTSPPTFSASSPNACGTTSRDRLPYRGTHQPHGRTHPAKTPHPGNEPTVTQKADNLLEATISYLSENNLLVHPSRSVANSKRAAAAATLGPQGPPMNVLQGTIHSGVIQTADPDDASLLSKLQSHLAHLPRHVSPATEALSPSHQSLAYYLSWELSASIGFQALHLTHPTSDLQLATGPVTKAWAADGGWLKSIPTQAIRAAWLHYVDTIGDKVKAAHTRHTALLLQRMTQNHSLEVRKVATIRLQAATMSPQDAQTLDTPPDRHAHQHQHPYLEPSTTSSPFPTPRHPHQLRLQRRRPPSSTLQRPPSPPKRQH